MKKQMIRAVLLITSIIITHTISAGGSVRDAYNTIQTGKKQDPVRLPGGSVSDAYNTIQTGEKAKDSVLPGGRVSDAYTLRQQQEENTPVYGPNGEIIGYAKSEY